jgi:hypothetical protein
MDVVFELADDELLLGNAWINSSYSIQETDRIALQ